MQLPPSDPNRLHAWHLYPVRLNLDTLRVTRNEFAAAMKEAGIGYSVHWRPLHLHPYYQQAFGARAEDCPIATELWPRLISMPIFPGMRDDELSYVASSVRRLCRRFAH
jgi:perosamine synthetase